MGIFATHLLTSISQFLNKQMPLKDLETHVTWNICVKYISSSSLVFSVLGTDSYLEHIGILVHIMKVPFFDHAFLRKMNSTRHMILGTSQDIWY